MSPKVTVLIPTFNRDKYLRECLDSVLSQTLPPAQVIVVNDRSTDRTRELLLSCGDRLEYLETPQLGKSGALNRGLANATGDYVWIFDDDDLALPDALERFVAPLEADAGYGFSYSTFYYTRSNKTNGRIGRVLSELQIPDLERRGFLAPLLENNFLGGAALFARTACYRAVGDFDPALVRSQDYEMAVRIARRFKGVRVSGGPTFHYRQHGGMRGSLRDRFKARKQLTKWLEYDQLFFRKLYAELPLGEYLPPLAESAQRQRQALLQRFTVMTTKLLEPEALKDLDALARLDDASPFSDAEREIVRELVSLRCRNVWNLLNWRPLPHAIRRRCASSKGVALFRSEILRAMLERCRKKPSPPRLLESALRALHLYL